MTQNYPLHIVDVFAEQRLAGNQLAVVRHAQGLSDEVMQNVAREMNFSETTFVFDETPERARVRIFTPEWELPFAGHPTLGTAWVISGGQGQVTLELPVGEVSVAFEGDTGFITAPEVAFDGELDVQDAVALTGLEASAFDAALPLQLARVGPAFALLPVRDLATLQRARLNGDEHQRLLDAGLGVQCVFLFSGEPYDASAHYAARMFFNSGGVREDPATGSANCAFAAYLRRHKGNLGRVVVDQGVEMRRASRLYLDVADTLRVGGKVVDVVRGEITL